ncbi:uncharacterized protein SPAPADRAFT_60130 [Spathaspora passalidarum NRRL Y-27907]|uniref:Uncharacterized protein n=1 Tax=Spathaspora passalidarum (strain NRRL Y-27907 / 11-Y1) TaxID=619300 RepID=G3AMD0_SPAPN|nr:uncharacterized protein SPAPADRAFT_60130 [Spathaspora passalidarum NRRL Y-27907]EGW32782.1 hypothetical protein SPAPADRAFT_60130 [Spathaspora passalidarum NRRL Y-27907]
MVYIRYPHQVPSRANKGRCSCVLNTRPVPEVTTTFGATTLASIQVTTTSDSVETSLEAFGSFVATPFPKTTSSIEGVPTAEATGIEEAPVTEVTPIVEQSSPSEEVSEVEEPVVVERV